MEHSVKGAAITACLAAYKDADDAEVDWWNDDDPTAIITAMTPAIEEALMRQYRLGRNQGYDEGRRVGESLVVDMSESHGG